MKLYIKQKVFSALPKFFVADENGNDKYEVRTPQKAVIMGLQLDIFDMAGTKCASVDQKMMSFQPLFRVYKEDKQVATIAKKFTLLKPKYVVEELGWTVQGDFTAHDYTAVDKSGKAVVSISKQWMTWGDTFQLEIADPACEMEALALVFAIDRVVDQEGSGNKVNGIDIGKL